MKASHSTEFKLIAPPDETNVTIKAMVAMQAPINSVISVKLPGDAVSALNNRQAKMVGDIASKSAFLRWGLLTLRVDNETIQTPVGGQLTYSDISISDKTDANGISVSTQYRFSQIIHHTMC